MNSGLLDDYSARVVIGLAVLNLLILFWLGRAWLIGTSPKTSRLFLLSLVALCGIVCFLDVSHTDFAQ